MGRRKKGLHISGWINLDKPAGMTSTQVVGKVRYLFNAQKAGHAGTLDPLATGILPIALGEATKTISFMQDSLKEYSFQLMFGESRTTDDAEGDVLETSDKRPSQEEVEAVLPNFIGHIEQTPPAFSAIKIDGQRAYDLARAGAEVEMKSRPAYIENINIIELSDEYVLLNVLSGKGVYMRSLGRDIAKACGTVGYIDDLRRHQVGGFDEEDAISLDKLEELRHNNALQTALLPLESALDDIPALYLNQAEAVKLKNGNRLSFVSKPDTQRLLSIGVQISNQNDPAVLLACFEDSPLGLVEVKGIHIQPVKMFNL